MAVQCKAQHNAGETAMVYTAGQGVEVGNCWSKSQSLRYSLGLETWLQMTGA